MNGLRFHLISWVVLMSSVSRICPSLVSCSAVLNKKPYAYLRRGWICAIFINPDSVAIGRDGTNCGLYKQSTWLIIQKWWWQIRFCHTPALALRCLLVSDSVHSLLRGQIAPSVGVCDLVRHFPFVVRYCRLCFFPYRCSTIFDHNFWPTAILWAYRETLPRFCQKTKARATW